MRVLLMEGFPKLEFEKDGDRSSPKTKFKELMLYQGKLQHQLLFCFMCR